jgi:signal transduction histidine kinase
VIFTDEESGLYSESSFSFTLKLYPTEVFMATYRTDNPMWGAIICVVIISFTAIVFGMYDHNVRGEFTFKNELLEAKRNFTRFLSHEVRTPLNSIYMGMVLMREELEKAMRDSKKVSSSVSDNNNGKSPPVSHHRLSEWKGMADDILENSQNAVCPERSLELRQDHDRFAQAGIVLAGNQYPEGPRPERIQANGREETNRCFVRGQCVASLHEEQPLHRRRQ